jgi:leader peptidase (prepilin peptidase)/N-methyltransferase
VFAEWNQRLIDAVLAAPVSARWIVAAVVGAFVGSRLTRWVYRLGHDKPILARSECRSCLAPLPWYRQVPVLSWLAQQGRCAACRQTIGVGVLAMEIGTAAVFLALTAGELDFRCQSTPDGGHSSLILWRLAHHLVLACLLLIATGIDFEQYIIPDSITVTGMVFAVAAATLAGNLQIIPLWVDWNLEHPLTGPYIPQWIKDHDRLHGFAWSMAGLLAGGGSVWLLRAVSRRVSGLESLGFGDVTLMAMVGAFIGWQPVLMAIAIAPLCGVLIGVSLAVCTGRIAVPYGPYLSAATLLVLLTFRWAWMQTKLIFGHWPTIAGLTAFGLVMLTVLLGLTRLFRSIPVPPTRTRPGDSSRA